MGDGGAHLLAPLAARMPHSPSAHPLLQTVDARLLASIHGVLHVDGGLQALDGHHDALHIHALHPPCAEQNAPHHTVLALGIRHRQLLQQGVGHLLGLPSQRLCCLSQSPGSGAPPPLLLLPTVGHWRRRPLAAALYQLQLLRRQLHVCLCEADDLGAVLVAFLAVRERHHFHGVVHFERAAAFSPG